MDKHSLLKQITHQQILFHVFIEFIVDIFTVQGGKHVNP